MLRRIARFLRGRPVRPTKTACQEIRDYDVLVFPVIDWDYTFQRPQHLSRELARRGHRVFYFSVDFVPDLCLNEPRPREVEPNIFLLRLAGGDDPPNVYRDLPDAEQTAAMVASIRRLREVCGLGATVSIVDYPFWLPVAERIFNNVLLYDCMDDYTSFSNAGRPAQELEGDTFARADLVVCSSLHLQAKARRAGRDSMLIRNAVEPAHFERCPDELALKSNGKIAGYYGEMGEWTDTELLAHAARSLPDVRFVFIGDKERSDLSELATLPNVLLLERVPYAELPRYLHAFDVCLLPYRICDYALASDPMKVWEYLSAGKPVVAVRFPEIERMAEVVTLTSDREQFVDGVRAALDGDSEEQKRKRREWARRNTWAERGDALHGAIEPYFPKVSLIVLSHNELRYTRVTLESLERTTDYPNLEIVLVDNGSTDGTTEFLEQWASDRKLAQVRLLGENSGFAAGINAGARESTGSYLVLMNNDLFMTRGWLGDLLAHFRAEPRLGLLCPVTNRSGNESVVDLGGYHDMEEMAEKAARYTRAHRGQRTVLGVMHLFCTMIPRAIWEEVGELDEEFGQGLFEDDDYTMRVRRAGYEIACAEDVFVHHHHSASFGKLPAEEYERLFERNRRYYESKWGPWEPPRARAASQG